MAGPIFNEPVEGKDNGNPVRQFGVGGFSDINSGVFGRTDIGFGVHEGALVSPRFHPAGLQNFNQFPK